MWSLMLLSCLKSVEPMKVSVSESVDTKFWASHPRWSGVTKLPNDVTLAFDVHFSVSEGQLTATMDIPMQNALGLKLSDITVTSDSINFVLKPPSQPKLTWAYYSMQIESEAEWSGTLTQMKQTFPTVMSAGTSDRLHRPQTPVPPFPYEESEIRVPIEGVGELVGTWVNPSFNPTPLVIMITGSGPQDRNEALFDHQPFAVLADYMARQGISSIRLDDRGVGDSSGSLEGLTTLDLANDCEAVLDYVQSLDTTHSSIGLLGHSEGGVIAAIVASRNPVDFVVSMAGTGVDGLEVLRRQVVDAMGVTDPQERKDVDELYVRAMGVISGDEEILAMRELILAQYKWMGLEINLKDPKQIDNLDTLIQQSIASINQPWMQAFLTLDPSDYWSTVSVPILVLNGTKDVQVASDVNPKAIKLAANRNDAVFVELFEDLNHLFQNAKTGEVSEYGLIEETMSPEVMKLVSEWVVEQSTERFQKENR